MSQMEQKAATAFENADSLIFDDSYHYFEHTAPKQIDFSYPMNGLPETEEKPFSRPD